MPNYTFECVKCSAEKTVFLPLADIDKVQKHCRKPMIRVYKPLQIVSDIQPYQAVAVDLATGKPPHIGSRRQHKEFLRRNKYVEVGNQPIRERKIIDVPDSHGDVKRTLDQFRSEGRWK